MFKQILTKTRSLTERMDGWLLIGVFKSLNLAIIMLLNGF